MIQEIDFKGRLKAAEEKARAAEDKLHDHKKFQMEKLQEHGARDMEELQSQAEGYRRILADQINQKHEADHKKLETVVVKERKFKVLEEEFKKYGIEMDSLDQAERKAQELKDNVQVYQNQKSSLEATLQHFVQSREHYQHIFNVVPADEHINQCHSTVQQIRACEVENSRKQQQNQQKQNHRSDYQKKINDANDKIHGMQIQIQGLDEKISQYQNAFNTIEALRADAEQGVREDNIAQSLVLKYEDMVKSSNQRLEGIEDLNRIQEEVNDLSAELKEAKRWEHISRNELLVEELFIESLKGSEEDNREEMLSMLYSRLMESGDQKEEDQEEVIVGEGANRWWLEEDQDWYIFN